MIFDCLHWEGHWKYLILTAKNASSNSSQSTPGCLLPNPFIVGGGGLFDFAALVVHDQELKLGPWQWLKVPTLDGRKFPLSCSFQFPHDCPIKWISLVIILFDLSASFDWLKDSFLYTVFISSFFNTFPKIFLYLQLSWYTFLTFCTTTQLLSIQSSQGDLL